MSNSANPDFEIEKQLDLLTILDDFVESLIVQMEKKSHPGQEISLALQNFVSINLLRDWIAVVVSIAERLLAALAALGTRSSSPRFDKSFSLLSRLQAIIKSCVDANATIKATLEKEIDSMANLQARKFRNDSATRGLIVGAKRTDSNPISSRHTTRLELTQDTFKTFRNFNDGVALHLDLKDQEEVDAAMNSLEAELELQVLLGRIPPLIGYGDPDLPRRMINRIHEVAEKLLFVGKLQRAFDLYADMLATRVAGVIDDQFLIWVAKILPSRYSGAPLAFLVSQARLNWKSDRHTISKLRSSFFAAVSDLWQRPSTALDLWNSCLDSGQASAVASTNEQFKGFISKLFDGTTQRALAVLCS